MPGEFHNSIEDVKLPEDAKLPENVARETDDTDALFCELCNIKVTSIKIMQRHLEGRRHKMKEERTGKTFVCELCDVVANSEIQLGIHLNSVKHKSKLSKKEHNEFFNTISTTTAGIWILLFCVVCIFVNLLLLFEVICN